MQQKYQGATPHFVKKVTSHGLTRVAKADVDAYKVFVNQVLSFYQEDEIAKYRPEDVAAVIQHSFEFIKTRNIKSSFQIRVFNPDADTDGYETPHTVVEILSNDQAFLVDSVTEAITRVGLKIYHLSHPLLDAGRDKKGKLTALAPMSKQTDRMAAESFMHIQISHLVSKKACDRIQRVVSEVLEAARYAYEDWHPIELRLGAAMSELLTSIEQYTRKQKAENQQDLLEQAEEIQAFLEWLRQDHFVFLGYHEFERTDTKAGFREVKDAALGIFKQGPQLLDNEVLATACTKATCNVSGFRFLELTKTSRKSLVHRPVHMDHITIRKIDENGKVTGEHCFLGLFTSIVYYRSVRDIPIIRKKLDYIRERSGFAVGGHSGKALGAVLEDYPRDELFQASEEDIFHSAMGIVALSVRPKIRLFIREDELRRFLSCIIMVPRDVMNTQLRERIEKILADAFGGTISNHYLQITEKHLARLQIIIKVGPKGVPAYDIENIQDEIARVARRWNDDFRAELEHRVGEEKAETIFEEYKNAFSVSYTNRFSAKDAYYDILKINEVITQNRIAFDIYEPEENVDSTLHFKVYSPDEQIELSRIMPILDNMGLRVIDEHTYHVQPASFDRSIWVHRFRFNLDARVDLALKDIKVNFETAISRVWEGKNYSDRLNALILFGGLHWREVVLVRAYMRYLQKAAFAYSQEFIQEALGKHPGLVKLLLELFYVRFEPSLKKKRQDEQKKIVSRIEQLLAKVPNLAEDRVVRTMMEVILATLRTNFYQKDEHGNSKDYLSFKLRSNDISILPQPRPYAEIYVFSPRMEGIHLRGGKVARGGLRWSDRIEDFRTEVLGLMKAQMTKNSVIIPVGSKGGFVVKKPPKTGGREAFLEEGVECYKTFLRGLLDLTDNMVGDKTVPPADMVAHDDPDPYLVVAADKGTATFSDIANGVAREYGFWLDDAFASGGSAGYDHKKMGITARGAWISVAHHFNKIGRDVDRDDFTVVGIGDMAGDVFGNGMLLSEHIALIGAFNHMHIFLDPNPDVAASYKERQRLFALPRSSWEDYNSKLISSGGGIFERSAKSIKLSKEIKKRLGTHRDVVTPDECIRLLLKSPVDLLWNGGIGTYVKSSLESHDDVGDKANDVVRINGRELRAKIVGEGGNLGLTQLGRIEYAMNGGMVNTDAIDNSAGVDCSDHEVNIKIALGQMVRRKKLTEKNRNHFLEEMTDEVAGLVLRDNRLQNQALSISGVSLSEIDLRFMRDLEERGRLDRAVEFLPSEEDLVRRRSEGGNLTRPEMSVLLAYAKLSLKEDILATSLPDDRYFEEDLQEYFPVPMRQKYKNVISSHPLRREIIATQIANSIMNRLSPTLFFRLAEDTGRTSESVARAYTIVRDVFGLRSMWEEIEVLSAPVDIQTRFSLLLEVQHLAERACLWFLHHYHKPLEIKKVSNDFAGGIAEVQKVLPKLLPPLAKKDFDNRLVVYTQQSVPEELAKRLASASVMVSGCDIVEVARQTALPAEDVGRAYFEVGERLHLSWLRSVLESMPKHSYWKNLSVQTMVDEFYSRQKRLTSKILADAKTVKTAVSSWIKDHEERLERFDQFVEDLRAQEEHDISMIVVALRKVEELG